MLDTGDERGRLAESHRRAIEGPPSCKWSRLDAFTVNCGCSECLCLSIIREKSGEFAHPRTPARRNAEWWIMEPGKIERLCLKARQAIEARDWEKAKQAY